MRRAIAVVALLLLTSLPASADEIVDPRVVYRIDGLVPATTGITVTVGPPVIGHQPPQIEVTNTTKLDLVVLDPAGVAMLRIGPSGSYGNVASAYLQGALDPRSAGARTKPSQTATRWERLGKPAKLRWYDTRARYTGHGPPDATQAQTLKSWKVAAVFAGKQMHITGSVQWKPYLGDVVPEIVSVRPQDPLIDVRIVAGPVPGIQLYNRSKKKIEIAGRDGKPFARVGPNGVEINVNSPTYTDTKQQPESKDPPKWTTLQVDPVLTWLEKRASFTGSVSDQIKNAKRRHVLSRWKVPGTIDGATYEIAGVTSWVPAKPSKRRPAVDADGESPLIRYALPGGIGVAAIGGAILLRRRLVR